MDYQTLIHQMKYAWWNPEHGRRETWDETVDRLRGYLLERFHSYKLESVIDQITGAIRSKAIMSSMRLLAMAGAAVERENLCAYNCKFMIFNSWHRFGELMYSLMCGTGVGFSVETQYVSQMCQPAKYHGRHAHIVFEDSREGWAYHYQRFLNALMSGYYVTYDTNMIRPAGSILKTTGGYASGPGPLIALMEYTRCLVGELMYRPLRPIDVYDLVTKVADVVVMGGVRRSACIAFFSPEDYDMWGAKRMPDIGFYPHRHNANNSVMFETEAQALQYLPRLLSQVKSTGEPGLSIRSVLKRKLQASGRAVDDRIGMNPCAEIILRDGQVCNLTEYIARPEHTIEQMAEYVELATIMGVLQAQLIDMNPGFLRKTLDWAIDEPLLGVSISGLTDDPSLLKGRCEALDYLKSVAKETAATWSKTLGCKEITAVTCVKPSGTVSKLVGCSPGVHPTFAKYYLSNIGVPRDTPLDKLMRESGVPVRHEDSTTVIYSFPQKAGDKSMVKPSALQQLTTWRKVNRAWADHNVSCTIYVQDHEWSDVEQWLRKHIGIVSGLTFIPAMTKLDHVAYMPLEEISREAYEQKVSEWVDIKWPLLKDDIKEITSGREFSCTSKEGCSL